MPLFSGGSRPSNKEGGGGNGEPDHPDPDIKWGGGGSLQKIFFRPFGPEIGLKIRGARAPPLDPPLLFTITSTTPSLPNPYT